VYESFYKLTGKPFALNPDPAFFYRSRGHARAFAYLQYGLFQSEGFVVVTGEVGSGKTTLVRSLLGQVDPRKVIAAQLVSTQLDADDLVRAVASAFGLKSKSVEKSQLLLEVEAFLVAVSTTGKRTLLIVDEAQNLTPRAVEELRMLSNFQLANRGLLQTFLVGQPELRDVMRSPHMQQLRQRVIGSYHLGPLEPAETQGYIEHRLKCVGWSGDPSFQADAMAAIHQLTGGIPRRINVLTDRLLLAGYLAEKHELKLPDVDAVAREMSDEIGSAFDLPTLTGANDAQAAAAKAGGARPAAGDPSVPALTASDIAKLESYMVSADQPTHFSRCSM
jgi:general secretion pathway protein A